MSVKNKDPNVSAGDMLKTPKSNKINVKDKCKIKPLPDKDEKTIQIAS
jgi:hypothetical protein